MDESRRKFIGQLVVMSAAGFIHRSSLLREPPFIIEKTIDEFPPLIHPPHDRAAWPAFIEKLHEWRNAKRTQLHYTGATYDDPAFHWANKNFSCGFLMIYDLDFYDRLNRRYTPEKIIARSRTEFGGFDSIVLWHAYPRIGIDDRNQFDFYRDMPGGLAGVRTLIDEFHRQDIRVFINYNPWDKGTRRAGKEDIELLVDVISAIDADGIFLDTLKEAAPEFRKKLDGIKKGIVLEGEFAADIENIPTNHLSWAQWFGDGEVPGILRNKWFERRHLQHQIARWDLDHSTELQQAWMNGSGMMIWENVFGQWIGWNERDKSILRMMILIQRKYHQLFTAERWTPLVDTMHPALYAGSWELDGLRLWTVVNRTNKKVEGPALTVPHRSGIKYYDLVGARELPVSVQDDKVVLPASLLPRSIGCFVAAEPAVINADFHEFLATIKKTSSRYNGTETRRAIHPVLRTVAPAPAMHAASPPDTVEIPAATVTQQVEWVIREVGTYSSYMDIDVVAELHKTFKMRRTAIVGHLAMDRTPVTNAAYEKFMVSSGYRPREPKNFLHHWHNGAPAIGEEGHPVVYVDLDDARAYAAWAKKRLPTEEEWQFAAQGYDSFAYPWGKEFDKDRCNHSGDKTTNVNEYPQGASPFGCLDMCGNAWEMTESEYADTHNRFCILKGGSYYAASGSDWYTSGGPQTSERATKFLMMYPGLDRCTTVGFRCAQDLP